jgi:hypothetical protein
MRHRGYFGLGQHAYLAGWTWSLHHSFAGSHTDNKTPVLPLDRMFFTSAFQAGIDHFVTQVPQDVMAGLDFMNDRVSPLKKEDLEIYAAVSHALGTFQISSDEQHKNVSVQLFLSDLICAMRSNAAMLSVVPVPNRTTIAEVFAPELAVPLIQLVSSLEVHNEKLPVPMGSIECEKVARFQRVLDSSAFARYCDAHEVLQEASADASVTLERIRESGSALVQGSKRILAMKNSLLYVLQIVPKLVDAVFGKLPGALAQVAGDAAQRRFDERKRIVVYQFDQWMEDVSRMAALQKKAGVRTRD